MAAPCLVKISSFRRCLLRAKQWPSISKPGRPSNSTFTNKIILKNCPKLAFETRLQRTDTRKSYATECEHSHCWNCGEKLEKEETFFCNCGVVQIIPENTNYFELMGCKESFDIETEAMSIFYKDLQRRYHPDKFSQKSQREQEIAESQSSFINKAYETLLKPLSRGLYLLELKGNPLEETNSSVDPEFLMEIMEINEDLAEAEGNRAAVEQLEDINNKRISLCVSEISMFFSKENVTEAKGCLIKLKYFINIQDKIKELYRKEM